MKIWLTIVIFAFAFVGLGINLVDPALAQDLGSGRAVENLLAGDFQWKPLAATRDKPFASPANERDAAKHWTDSISHGELIRIGFDQTLEVDPANLRFLFQGVSDHNNRDKEYGAIPWQLGQLESRR